jgi:hypothetical protein
MQTTFSEQQYDMFYPPGIEHHWWTVARNRLLAKILRRNSDSNDVFLEVGCGRGLVVKSLKDSGFNICGVELADVKPMDKAQQMVISGTDACDLPIEQRAEITGLLLLDVIEHLAEPEQFLRRLEESFPKLSVVIVTVPARKELWSNYDSFCGHYRRYSLGMLEELSSNLNWTAKSMGYFFRLSYFPMRLMTLFGIDRNISFTPPGKIMRLLHYSVSVVCQMEQLLVPRQIRGSSAYAVYYPGKTERQ